MVKYSRCDGDVGALLSEPHSEAVDQQYQGRHLHANCMHLMLDPLNIAAESSITTNCFMGAV